MTPLQIVWFKRDLRVCDHRALSAAAQRGPVLPLYVVEPDLWQQPDMSARQWAFVAETLAELQSDLARLGQPLVLRTGEICNVLTDLRADWPIAALWSHEETGNAWTFDRDKRVAAWCREAGLEWHELRNHGVIRRMKERDGWAGAWDRFMKAPLTPPPALSPIDIAAGTIPCSRDLGLAPDPCPLRQRGGRTHGLERLNSFLTERGAPYRSAMSSPVEGERACSRLSPHLAWGSLSVREVKHATAARQHSLRQSPGQSSPWGASLRSFSSRLHWHCHFIQKLEDAPALEYRNMHRAYDGLRPSAPDQDRLVAWQNGETGLPFVDACMRYLRATGWLNFRMRAMVMSVASYHLWLNWSDPGRKLAQLFTDYEPGIHWSQVQMQSGTTGINAIRIYNPIKQGYDQDPSGQFIRKWIPELASIADHHLHEPWKAQNADQVLGRAYPRPIIDHMAAAKFARDQVWSVRRGAAFKHEAGQILHKHGSRKRRAKPIARRKKPDAGQLQLPLGEPKP